MLDKLDAHEAWRAARPATKLDHVGPATLRTMIGAGQEAALGRLIEEDLAVKPEIDSITDVEKLCRLQRDLGKLLNNYVNFSEFYGRKGGVFQAGTLYLDGRGCNLVFEVTDSGKHAAMAPMAGAYLAYCECTRAGGEKKAIAAAFTAGDVDNLIVGRNGVFVDRQGRDWETTITKIVDAPISIRQAFWAPYKKLVRMIEERVAKRAADADAASNARLEGAATAVATADKPAAPPPVKKGMDIGTVAAIGVAVGGIAAVVTAVFGGVFGLGRWMPIGIALLMVAISAPSMVLASIKLRRRNLGPLLDANGWAINALTRINIRFGTALTALPRVPRDAVRSLSDPYADRRQPWAIYVALAIVGSLAIGWYYGKLDRWLPDRARTSHVLARALAGAAPAGDAAAPDVPAVL